MKMILTLLLISKHPEDKQLANKIAINNSLIVNEAQTVPEIIEHFDRFSDTLVLWDAEDPVFSAEVQETLKILAPPNRVFAITENELGQYPHLLRNPTLVHHLQRRFQDPAGDVYARLTQAYFQSAPQGLVSFFGREQKINTLSITQSIHKRAAIEAMQNTLTKQGLQRRLAALVAQCLDELILDAVLDAKTRVAATTDAEKKNGKFTLGDSETITVEFTSLPNYFAICVTNRARALTREQFLITDATAKVAAVTGSTGSEAEGDRQGAGAGLQGVIQSGLSAAVVSYAGKSTQATLFVPAVASFKDFRKSFRFFSFLQVY